MSTPRYMVQTPLFLKKRKSENEKENFKKKEIKICVKEKIKKKKTARKKFQKKRKNEKLRQREKMRQV